MPKLAPPEVVLRVNRSDAASVQVNVTTRVNAAKIRRETHNGREHWVIPSYTLPANVIMNGGLYPSSEIDAHFNGLEGTLAPLGHPYDDGKPISAFTPEAINAHHVGAFNRNVKKAGNRIYVEKWLDIQFAKNTEGGTELLERLEAIEKGEEVPPIHTSVAVFLEELAPNKEQAAAGAQWVAKIHGMDHDAILLHESGAATPDQGVGMMVNADTATPLKPNVGVLSSPSYRDKEGLLDQAARKQFVADGDDYAWIADFTDTQAIVVRNGGEARVYEYKTENGTVTFEGEGVAVQRQESWVATAYNSIKRLFNHQARPDNQPKEVDMTPEEKAAMLQEMKQVVNDGITEAIKPMAESIQTLQANQKDLSDQLTANSRAEEAEKRAVVAEALGELAANSLTGEALDEAYAKIGKSKPLGEPANNSSQDGAPNPDEYFPE